MANRLDALAAGYENRHKVCVVGSGNWFVPLEV